VIAVPDVWAVVPVKEFADAKRRLSPLLTPKQRRALTEAMVEDVLAALAQVKSLAGRIVVTVDPLAAELARRYGATVFTEGARDGHTGAVTAAAARLARDGRATMLAIPGDIPLVTAAELEAVLAVHRVAPSFTIVPSHDDRGSNAIVLSPPDAVPLRYGDDSFFPHLAAARARGIEPTVTRQDGIALDIDNPEDLTAFLRASRPTRALEIVSEAEHTGRASA
jgi:2-phospho-L-lactate/phosphoenolpyruvate guanylyltransferase